MTSKAAAFFDLDRTLIDINSGLQWAKHERRQNNISALQFGRAMFWGGMYHLSLINMKTAMEGALAHYKGVRSDELNERTCAWFFAEVEQRVRPGALKAIAEHRSKGHPLVIVTNASYYEARVAAKTWTFDDYLGNEFELDEQGRLTGALKGTMCYGQGKVLRVSQWAKKNNVDLKASYFYSDSLSDVPLLEAVGHPRVVMPDPRLRRVARKRRWEILSW